ncbi:MAG: tetratricopeptide repeat protein [Gemmatimonadota bacterium]
MKGNLDEGLRAIERAHRIVPRDASVLAALGYLKRRQGRFEEAINHFALAARQDPLNPDHRLALATTNRALRRYEEAERAYQRMADVSLDPTTALVQHGELHLIWRGDPVPLREALASVPADDATGTAALGTYRLAMIEGRYDDAATAMARVGVDAIGGTGDARPVNLLRAWALLAAGDSAGARRSLEAARSSLERQVRTGRTDGRLHAGLGLVLAGLGRTAEAIEHGRRATALEPTATNAMYGPSYEADLAAIFAWAGEPDSALVRLERLLEVPAGISPHQLRLDPQWAPLRGDARFQALAGSEPEPIAPS